MMRIGLLTYYGDLNFGTNLQAYATLQALKRKYPHDTVEIIPFHSFRNRLIPYKSFSVKSIYRDIVRICKFLRFKKDFLEIKSCDPVIQDVSKALKYIKERMYDIIYVGADTLLELDRLPQKEKGLSAYWLKDIKAQKILIAASAKNVDYKLLDNFQKQEMTIAVNQFSALGVRDIPTYQLMESFNCKEKLEYVPDPTFTYNIDYNYAELYWKRKGILPPKKSILIHPYKNEVWLDKIVEELKKEGFFIASMRPKKWANLVMNDLGPLEQTGIYHYFTCVITHRFHDSVFCLKNRTPFLLYVSNSKYKNADGESKQTSILKDFGLYPNCFLGYADENIIVDNIVDRINSAKEVFAVNKIKERLEEKKCAYLDFLTKN